MGISTTTPCSYIPMHTIACPDPPRLLAFGTGCVRLAIFRHESFDGNGAGKTVKKTGARACINIRSSTLI